jgi:YVTN family beta-propeller protein
VTALPVLVAAALAASPSTAATAPPDAAPRAASPTGTLVVLAKAEAKAFLVDLATGRAAATVPTGEGPHEVAVSPDGRTAVVANYGTRSAAGSTLTVIDLPGARALRTIRLAPGTRPHGVLFLDARRALVTAEGAKALLVVDVAGGTVEAVVETGQEISHMVAATPDGRRAFVANIGSGTVTVVDVPARRVLAHVRTGEGAEGIAVSPDGREAWVTNRAADTVSVVDVGSLAVVASIPCASFPIRVAFTPDGRRALVTNARSGDVALLDVAARKEVRRMRAPLEGVEAEGRLLAFAGSTPIGVVVAPGGARAFVAHASADAVAELDLETGRMHRALVAGREPDGMAWSPVAVQARGRAR